MFIKPKYVSFFTIMIAVLLLAAQCGTVQPATEAPATVERAPVQVEAQAVEAEHGTENHGDTETPEAEEHEHEAEEHEHEIEEHEHEAEEHEAEEHNHEAEAHEHEHEVETAELAPVNLAEGEKLKVVATTGIVADIVANIGGDRIELIQMLPVGADPHTFEPAPRDLTAVADAHVVFANGLGLEGFIDSLIENAGGEAAVIHVSEGIEPREFSEKHGHEEGHEGEAHEEHQEEHEATDHEGEAHEEHEAEGHHHHEGADPHTWTTPVNAIVFVHNIKHALSALDPANTATYEANAELYKGELEELDQWVREQVETIPPENRELVTDHTAFGYYADRYGLEQVGAVIPAFSTAASPSAQELAELENAIREYDVQAIFVGASVNPSLSKQVAEDTGVKLVTLYTGSLGPEGSDVESYLDYIRYNTNAIVEGLK